MKKRILKSICSKALAITVGTVLLVQTQAPVVASAAKDPTLYISEVYLSYGKTDDEAKQWLKDHDYTILDQNLNEGTDAGVSWIGLGSEKRSVYLGYKTTENSDDAITDMRAMNMNGDYSYDEYEKVLVSKKAEIAQFVSNMQTAIAEYRENYKNGAEKAKTAHDKMNTLLDADSNDTGLGDLLLKPTKEEMGEEEYNKAPKEHADMTTIILQGNVNSISSLMTNLCLAADTSKEGWVARLKASKGVDGLFKSYEQQYPGLSESKLTSLMLSEYDEQAKILADRIDELKESIKAYTECPVKADADAEKIEAYFKEHPNANQVDWSKAGVVYMMLSDIKYGGSTMAELVTGNKYDFSDPEDRIVLYPIIDAMSKGQRALLSYVDLGELFISGGLTEDGWKQSAEEIKKLQQATIPVSIYHGIDRSVFQPAGVALTSQARKIQSSTGSSYTGKMMGVDVKYLQWGGIASTVVILGVGISSLVHGYKIKKVFLDCVNRADDALISIAKSSKDVIDNFLHYLETKGITEFAGDEIKNYTNRADGFTMLSNLRALARSDSTVQHSTSQLETSVSARDFLNEFTSSDDAVKKAYDKYDNAMNELGEEYFENTGDGFIRKTVPARGWRVAGTILCIAGALMAIGTAVVTIYDTYQYYHQKYSPIPRRIVHESTDEKGRSIYTIFNCALCNRADQGFKNDKLGDYGDMNGDVGKQWLSLYTTKEATKSLTA